MPHELAADDGAKVRVRAEHVAAVARFLCERVPAYLTGERIRFRAVSAICDALDFDPI